MTRSEQRSWQGPCLHVRCGGWSHAIRLDAVAETVPARGLVRLPLSPPPLVGLCSLRRGIVPVFRLDVMPGQLPIDTPDSLVLVLRDERGDWGLLVDEGSVEVIQTATVATPETGEAACTLGQLPVGAAVCRGLDEEVTWDLLRREVEVWYRSIRACGRMTRRASSAVRTAVRIDEPDSRGKR